MEWFLDAALRKFAALSNYKVVKSSSFATNSFSENLTRSVPTLFSTLLLAALPTAGRLNLDPIILCVRALHIQILTLLLPSIPSFNWCSLHPIIPLYLSGISQISQ